MNLEQAMAKASRLARSRCCWMYVFGEGEKYDVGTEYDADTFFLGCEPVASFGPDGARED